LGSEFVREGELMGASRSIVGRRVRRARGVVTSFGVATVIGALASATAGASSRQAISFATTSSTDGAVLLALGGGVLVLGGIGFVVFTWTRRKRRPVQCAEQREALELAERAVQYWQAARAHLEAVEKERTQVDASGGASHESLVAKADEGLNHAMQQRDQCQLDLIHCMASGVPAVPVIPSQVPQPFFTPGTGANPPSTPPYPTDA
jgi:hypothetical protein